MGIRKGMMAESAGLGAVGDTKVDEKKKLTKAMQKSEDNAQALVESWTKPKGGPKIDAFTEESIAIANILLDEDNTRTRHILPGNPTHNALSEDHPDYHENQGVIDSIIEFAEHFKTEPLQTRIGLYPYKGKHKLVFGTRRFLGMKVAYGDRYKIPSKVYPKKPKKIGLMRFTENASQSALPMHAKLKDFASALTDVKGLTTAEAYRALGIPRATYFEYKSIVSNAVVFAAMCTKKIGTKEAALELMQRYPIELELVAAVEEYANGVAIEDISVDIAKKSEPVPVKKKGRRGKTRTSLKFPPLKGSENGYNLLKAIIAGDLNGYDWEEGVDWQSMDSVQERLNQNMEQFIADKAK